VALKNWATTPVCLRLGSALATATPVSMACWFNPTAVGTVSDCFINLIASGGNGSTTRNSLTLGTTFSPTAIKASADTNGTVANAATTTAQVANVWQHACAVFTSPTSRAAYLDGAGKGTNATSNTPSGLNRTSVGLSDDAGPNQALRASIAHVAVWNVALTDHEVFLLSRGADPRTIQPAYLLVYLPCVGLGGQEFDLSGRGNNFAVVGAVQPADDGVLLDRPFEREWFDRSIKAPASAVKSLPPFIRRAA
jgi:hypothetical protein